MRDYFMVALATVVVLGFTVILLRRIMRVVRRELDRMIEDAYEAGYEDAKYEYRP